MLPKRMQNQVSTRWSLLLAGSCALASMYLVLAMIGALSENEIIGLPTVPELTLWGLPLSLLIRDIAMALTVGSVLVGGVLAPRPDAFLGRLTSLSALVWILAIATQSVFTVSEVLAFSISDSLNVTVWWSLLSQTTVGQVMLVQTVILVFVAILGWVVLDRVTGIIISSLAIIAAFLPGLTGHSSLTDTHNAASISLGIHIVAMSAWIGGLVALVIYLLHSGNDSGIVIRRFSTLALISVIALVESGLLNASLRLDGPAALVTSVYGAILLAKISILIVLISFGWRVRKKINESAEEGPMNNVAISLLAGREILWMGLVLGLSVALSRTAPPGEFQAGDQLIWVALLALALFLPFSIYYLLPRGKGTVKFFQKYPDVSAIALTIWLYLFITFFTSVTIGQSIGAQWFALLGSLLTIFLGYQFISSLSQNRSWSTAGFAVVGIPLVGWWLERDVTGGLHWSFWVMTLFAILFVLSLMRPIAPQSEIPINESVRIPA
jgi:putative copper export protein